MPPPPLALPPPSPVGTRVPSASDRQERQRGSASDKPAAALSVVVFLFLTPMQLSFWSHHTHPVLPTPVSSLRDSLSLLLFFLLLPFPTGPERETDIHTAAIGPDQRRQQQLTDDANDAALSRVARTPTATPDRWGRDIQARTTTTVTQGDKDAGTRGEVMAGGGGGHAGRRREGGLCAVRVCGIRWRIIAKFNRGRNL